MLSKTHIPVGVATSYALSIYFNDPINSNLILTAILGSILPDIDVEKSWISQLCPIPFHIPLVHRKGTHLNFRNENERRNKKHELVSKMCILSLFCYLIVQHESIRYFLIGYITHLILDYKPLKKHETKFFYVSYIIITIVIIYKLYLNI